MRMFVLYAQQLSNCQAIQSWNDRNQQGTEMFYNLQLKCITQELSWGGSSRGGQKNHVKAIFLVGKLSAEENNSACTFC